MKINKTNAARLLDKAKIAYELIPYEVDEADLSAVHVAASLGEDINCVFKTLVLHGDKSGYFVCVIPGENEVDLKLAAKVSGNKKCDLIPVKELLPLTGYIRGGCSPIGMKKTISYLHSRNMYAASIHLYQCRCPWPAAEAGSTGPYQGSTGRSLYTVLIFMYNEKYSDCPGTFYWH